jgi:hypothetical protein
MVMTWGWFMTLGLPEVGLKACVLLCFGLGCLKIIAQTFRPCEGIINLPLKMAAILTPIQGGHRHFG